MSYINSYSKRLFGLSPDLETRAKATGSVNQDLPELVPLGTTARKFVGSRGGGGFSIQGYVSGAGGAGSTLTYDYSNLPDPNPASDAHWTATAGTSVITATGPVGIDTLGKGYEWVRVKLVVATSACSLYLWVRSDCTDV